MVIWFAFDTLYWFATVEPKLDGIKNSICSATYCLSSISRENFKSV